MKKETIILILFITLYVSGALFSQGTKPRTFEHAPDSLYTFVSDSTGQYDHRQLSTVADLFKEFFTAYQSDTNYIDIVHAQDTLRGRFRFKLNGVIPVIGQGGSGVGKIDTFSFVNNIISLSLENDDEPAHTIDLSDISISRIVENQVIGTDSMIVVTTLPASVDDFDVFVKDSGLLMKSVATPTHPIHFKKVGQVLRFYEIKNNETIEIHIIN